MIRVGGKTFLTHRLSYMLLHEDPLAKMVPVDHLCRVTRCWNPDHLEAVTAVENVRRQREAIGHHNEKKTHCSQGHAYDEANTIVFKHSGTGKLNRKCRECARLRSWNFNEKLRQERKNAG